MARAIGSCPLSHAFYLSSQKEKKEREENGERGSINGSRSTDGHTTDTTIRVEGKVTAHSKESFEIASQEQVELAQIEACFY